MSQSVEAAVEVIQLQVRLRSCKLVDQQTVRLIPQRSFWVFVVKKSLQYGVHPNIAVYHDRQIEKACLARDLVLGRVRQNSKMNETISSSVLQRYYLLGLEV